eukprot:593050-Karenia_brevis.AAC.1
MAQLGGQMPIGMPIGQGPRTYPPYPSTQQQGLETHGGGGDGEDPNSHMPPLSLASFSAWGPSSLHPPWTGRPQVEMRLPPQGLAAAGATCRLVSPQGMDTRMLLWLRWLLERAWVIIIIPVQRKGEDPACPCHLSRRGEAQPKT